MIHLIVRSHDKDVVVTNTYIGEGEPREPVEFVVPAGKLLKTVMESNVGWTTTLTEREPV